MEAAEAAEKDPPNVGRSFSPTQAGVGSSPL
jgi:hypothetical protein